MSKAHTFPGPDGEDVEVYVFPPTSGKGSEWLARTRGGARDSDPWAVDHPTRAGVLTWARQAARTPALR